MATKQHNKTHKECSFWNLKELIPKEKTQTFILNCAFIQTSKKFKSGKCNYDRDIVKFRQQQLSKPELWLFA